MAGNLQPLEQKFPITKSDGTPTEYFIRWAQQRQIDIGEGITAEQAVEIITQYLADHQLQEGSGISLSPSGNISDSPTIAAEVQAILDQITNVQGSILFRGASGWDDLAAGTAGDFLKTNGAGANLEWASAGGSGGGYFQIHFFGSALTTTTVTVNSTTYIAVLPLAFLMDRTQFPATDYRILLRGSSNAAAQTVTLQLASAAAPATPVHTGGNDVVITNTTGNFDSGWLSFDDGASGVWNGVLALKGSNATVDLTAIYCDLLFRI